MFLLCFPFILFLLFTILFYSLSHLISESRYNKSKLPPGSSGWWPFLGHSIPFITPHPSCSNGQFLNQNIKRYGKIFRSHIFGCPTIVSCDAEFNSFILQNEDRLFHAGYPSNIPRVLGDLTLLNVTGEVHKRLRSFTLNLFASIKTPTSLFLTDIEDNVTRIIRSWKNKETLVFVAEARKFTFSVIVKQILNLGVEDPDAVKILENYTTFMKGLVSFPINFPGTPYAKAIQARYQIQETLKNIQRQRQSGKQAGKTERMDFLDVLLTQENISEQEISSLVVDLLFGGYETTAMLISIIVRYLGESSNSQILNELREEHASIKRSKNANERLDWDDYKKMEFTQCLINETLRLGNVVKFVHRKTIKPIKYKGYEIPAGWKVLPILSSIHLDPSLYPEPLKFDPHRWQKEDATVSRKFMPFGGGKRLCSGSELGRLEASFFLHHLVLNYSWTPLVDTDWPMHHPYTEFKNGMQVAIQPLKTNVLI